MKKRLKKEHQIDCSSSDNSLIRHRYLSLSKKNQLNIFVNYLADKIATASMISRATGIPQKNICRYKRQLEKTGVLCQLMKCTCQETGYSAWYLSLTSKPDRSSQLDFIFSSTE